MLLTIYLKPTNACNLNCMHCYVSNEKKRDKSMLSIQNIETIAQKINQLLPSSQCDVNIVWHGGECTLVGKGFFAESAEIFKYYSNRDKYTLSHSLQSNMINLDESWVPLIKTMFNSIVGTSYDPEIRILDGSFQKFEDKWIRNLRLLQNNSIHIAVNITLTKPLIKNGCNYLYDILNKINVGEYHLERFTPRGEGSKNADLFYADDHMFYSFLIEAVEVYFDILSNNQSDFLLSPFDALYISMTQGRGAGCWGGNCMSTAITINPDGTVSSCPDLAVAETFTNKSIFGNILTDVPLKILSSKSRINLIAKQKKFLCDCEYITVCNGGCPLHFHGSDRKSCKSFFSRFAELQKTHDFSSFFIRQRERKGDANV